MHYYTLKQLGAYAKRLRKEAGDSLRVAADRINEEVRREEEGEVHFANIGKAESGSSKYEATLRDEIELYADHGTFSTEPYYSLPVEPEDLPNVNTA
jgi:hypothetical protein